MLSSVPDINNMRQNHPELIVRDLLDYVPPDVTRRVLKERGVYKWLTARRLLIQLKNRWRERINLLQQDKLAARREGDMRRYYELKGYVEALTDCRQQVRAICHSPRDVDFPEQVKWGIGQVLPDAFPLRPHKRWLCSHKGGMDA